MCAQGLFEQFFAADDFLIFKSMMVQRNIDLELQALSLLQKQLGSSPEAYKPSTNSCEPVKPPQRSQEADEDDRILEEILRQSKEEYEKQLLTEAEAEMLLTLTREESLRLHQASLREQQDLAEKLEKRAAEAMAEALEASLGEDLHEVGADEAIVRPSEAVPDAEQPLTSAEPEDTAVEPKAPVEEAHSLQPTVPQLHKASVEQPTSPARLQAQLDSPITTGGQGAKESVGAAAQSELSGTGARGLGVRDISGAEAAQMWLESARSEVQTDSNGGTERILVWHTTSQVSCTIHILYSSSTVSRRSERNDARCMCSHTAPISSSSL